MGFDILLSERQIRLFQPPADSAGDHAIFPAGPSAAVLPDLFQEALGIGPFSFPGRKGDAIRAKATFAPARDRGATTLAKTGLFRTRSPGQFGESGG